MKKYYLLLFFIHSFVFAQVGIGTTTPDNSTMLDIFSTSKGFLVPRLSTFQRVSISSPATGLQVYDTTTNTLWYFNGTIWVQGTSFSSASKWTNDTSNSLVKLTNLSDGVTARIVDNSFVINDTGNVGIGTINPVSPLSISGTNASILIERFGLASHLVLRNAGGTKASPLATPAGQGTARLSGWSYDGTSYLPNGYIDILANGTQTATSRSGDMVFTTTDLNSTAATEKMRITPDGKVGIGTSNPNGNFEIETPNITKLNVNSTSATQFSQLRVTAGLNSGYLYAMAPSYVTSPTYPQYENGGVTLESIGTTSGLNFSTQNATPIKFFTNSNQKMILTTSGNLGIGTTTPTEKLEVIGSVKTKLANVGNSTGVKLDPTISNQPTISFHASDDSNRFNIATSLQTTTTSDLLSFNAVAKNNILTLKGDGNVGIGTATANANAILEVASTTKGILIPRLTMAQINAITSPAQSLMVFNTDSNLFYFYNTSNSAWMPINVGSIVSTANTTYTLSVLDNGTILDFTSNSPVTLTVPNILPIGFQVSITQAGTGQVTVVGSGGMVVNNRWAGTKTSGQWAKIGVEVRATNVAILSGDVQ